MSPVEEIFRDLEDSKLAGICHVLQDLEQPRNGIEEVEELDVLSRSNFLISFQYEPHMPEYRSLLSVVNHHLLCFSRNRLTCNSWGVLL